MISGFGVKFKPFPFFSKKEKFFHPPIDAEPIPWHNHPQFKFGYSNFCLIAWRCGRSVSIFFGPKCLSHKTCGYDGSLFQEDANVDGSGWDRLVGLAV